MSTLWDRRRRLAVALLALSVAGLGAAGCCGLGLKNCTQVDRLIFNGDAKLNSCNADGYSSPVKVRIYYLTDPGLFNAIELQDLLDDHRRFLDESLVALSTKIVTVVPGQEVIWEDARPAGAVWLGIAGNFCELDAGAWRATIRLEKGLRATVELKDVSLTVIPDK